MITFTPSSSRRVWLRKKGFCRDRRPFLFECMVPVFSITYISSGGQPDVMYERTHCWRRGQERVKPMNSGVFSLT